MAAAKRAKAAGRRGQRRSQTASGTAPALRGRAASFRLPEDVRPERYELRIEVDPQRSKSYRGRVRIELVLARSITALELHAVDLKLGGARIESGGRTLRARVETVPEHEAVRILLPDALPKGKAVLELSFRGKLRDDLRGLYFARSSKRRYAFSQLEAADARRFFPCFDEPSFKARFAIEVVTGGKHAVISNAPEQSRTRLPGGKVRVRFADTPRLSTYLVALAVGDLRKSRAVLAGTTPIRVWHVPGQEKLTAFALAGARECLLRLARYFAVPYPYQKLDLVAVPDFDMGAMENAGAVFFRETLLLVDERRATLPEKKRALEVICHELAHMWYGNLVTMAWWDDLWLNEAFATWMAFDIVDDWRPELRMWNDFGHSRDSALDLDALEHTHPIYTRVRTPAEATENFDLITYEKGAAVIRMLERYLGEGRFRRGVRDYIKSHREQNAVAADLWRALERQAGEQIDQVVRPWVERAGFPLLRATRTGPGRRTLVLEQERFSARGPGGRRGKRADRPWPVPVVLKIGVGKGTGKIERHLLTGASQRVSLPARARFVYANADEGGFYRPLHDERSLGELATNVAELSATERLGLLTHSWALVAAGYGALPSFLELFAALGAEPDPDVLAALHSPLWHVLDRVADEQPRDALRKVIAAVFMPALRAAGWTARKHEREHERLRRAELLGLLCLLAEEPDALREAELRCERYLRDPRSLEPNLVGPVVLAGARAGDSALHARYLKLSTTAGTPQERRRFRMALCEFRDGTCIDRTLALCLTERIPKQDLPLLLARLLDNPSARERAWRFMQKRWGELGRRISPQLVSRLIDATPALQGERKRREVMAFFVRHPVPTAQRALRQANERFRLDAELRKRAAPELARWLRAAAAR
jgi:puromycin-sensitive aminopeptidase